MTAGELFRFLHILFAFLFIAGEGVWNISNFRLRRLTEVAAIEELRRAARFSDEFIANPAFLLTVVFGALAAWKQGYDLLREGWLLATYVTAAIAFVFANTAIRAAMGRINRALADAKVKGRVTDELRAAVTAPGVWASALVLNLALLFILVLMVYRPF